MSEALTSAFAGMFSPQPQGRVFLNAAYMTPKPISAVEAMEASVARLASPDFAVPDFFETPERVRGLIAQLVGGPAGSYSLNSAASYGMATLAWNLRLRASELVGKRRRIVGLDGQFPSNVQTWQRLTQAGFQFDLVEAGPGADERLLAALDDRCALLAIAPLSWTTGSRLDIRALIEAARRVGALSLLDVTQCAGVDPAFDGESLPDVLVGAGYKWMLGPYGTGYLRLTPALQESLEPLETNWKNFTGASDFNRLTEYASEFASPASKFDQGESSAFIRLSGWEAGLRCLLEIGPARVQAHAERFAASLRAKLDPEHYKVSDTNSPRQAAHLFRIEPLDSHSFEALSAAFVAAGVSISQRGGGWRVSPHVYNDEGDAQRLAKVLEQAKCS